MKKIIALGIIVGTVALYAATLSIKIERTLTEAETAGLVWATGVYNAQQKAGDTNWVDIAPSDYLQEAVTRLLSNYAAQANVAAEKELAGDLETIKAAYRDASEEKRAAIMGAASVGSVKK